MGQLGLTPPSWTSLQVPELMIKPDFFSLNYFMTGEDDEDLFSIPGNIAPASLKLHSELLFRGSYTYIHIKLKLHTELLFHSS
jgi:hypothetical protein